MNNVFTIEQLRPIRDGFTISRDTRLGDITKVTLFSLGKKPRSVRKAMIA